MFKAITAGILIVSTFMALGMYAQARYEKSSGVISGVDAIEVLRTNGRYKILLMALEDTNTTELLRRKEPTTLFAPTDEAFQKVPKLADLLHDHERLERVLRNHVIIGERVSYSELRGRNALIMYGGEKVDVRSDGRNVNDAQIETPDIEAGTVVIHGIDKVLMENNDSKLRQAGETLEAGVKFAGEKVYDGLKTGAEKVKDTFEPKK
jgi:uncharacterized surface protein with fasciclin (FAS1) repeats